LTYLIPVILAAIDQASKYLIITKLSGKGIFFIDQEKFTFAFQLVKNPNLAFSIAIPQYFIFAIVIIITMVLVIFLYRAIKQKNDILIFAFLLIILSAVSNLVDRLIHGAVIDFVSLKIFGMQLAVFNMADVWIVLGVAILLFKESFKMKKL